MRIVQAIRSSQPRNIHISDLGLIVGIDEHVGRFQISMHDVQGVKSLETLRDLNENLPDIVFGVPKAQLPEFLDLVIQVTLVCVLHQDAANL